MSDARAHAGADGKNRRVIIIIIGRLCFVAGRTGELPDERAARNFDQQVLARVAVHAFAHAWLALFGDQPWLIILRDQIVDVAIPLENDVPAAPAIAAAGPALGSISLALEGHGALPAVPGARIHFYFINEH